MPTTDLHCTICMKAVAKNVHFDNEKMLRKAAKETYFCIDHKHLKKVSSSKEYQWQRIYCIQCEKELSSERFSTQAQLRKIAKKVKYCSDCKNRLFLVKEDKAKQQQILC